jgi:hypothetical protein
MKTRVLFAPCVTFAGEAGDQQSAQVVGVRQWGSDRPVTASEANNALLVGDPGAQ